MTSRCTYVVYDRSADQEKQSGSSYVFPFLGLNESWRRGLLLGRRREGICFSTLLAFSDGSVVLRGGDAFAAHHLMTAAAAGNRVTDVALFADFPATPCSTQHGIRELLSRSSIFQRQPLQLDELFCIGRVSSLPAVQSFKVIGGAPSRDSHLFSLTSYR